MEAKELGPFVLVSWSSTLDGAIRLLGGLAIIKQDGTSDAIILKAFHIFSAP